MPTFGDDVHVEVSDTAIITVLNGPGGAMRRWRDATARQIVRRAQVLSPKNKVANARHRNSVVGIYKRSWKWNDAGSGGHHLQINVFNTAPYASYVEFDSGVREGRQTFSWARWGGKAGGFYPPYRKGQIGTVRRTGARAGKHVLRNAVNLVMPTRCDGYTGLP